MSAVYGISGFIDGFVKGREQRNSWEDRKLDRERQKKLDELTLQRDARDAEAHAARMGVYRREQADWETAHDKQAAWDAANKAAVDATNAAMDGGQPIGAVPPEAAAGVAQSMGLPVSALGGNMNAAIEAGGGMGVPQRGLGAVARPEQIGPTVAAASAIPKAAAPSTANLAPTQTPAVQPSGPRISYDQWRSMSRGEREKAGLPVSEIGGQLHFNRFGVGAGWNEPVYGDPVVDPMGLMPNKQHDWGNSLVGDAAEVGRRGLAGIGAAEEGALGLFNRGWAKANNAVDAPMNAIAGYVTGADLTDTPVYTGNGAEVKRPSQIADEKSSATFNSAMSDLSGTWKKATDKPDTSKMPLQSNVAPSAPPVTKQLAATATDAMAATASPGMQAAAAAAEADPKSPTKAGLGVKPGAMVTDSQRTKAAGAFMDYYREYGAPIVMQDMLKRGDFKGAQAFQEFLDTDATKAGMESWAKAAFAANIGDMDTFASEIMKAYNRLDYFPDGTTIVEDESGFTYDKNGEISGAKITFKDEKTGNTFDQVFSDPNDLVRLGITMLAPEEAFKHFADQAATQAASEKDAAKVAQERQDKLNTRVDAVAAKIMEASKGLDGVPTMSYAQARAEAEATLNGLGTTPTTPENVPTAAPPVMYRP